MAIIEDLLVSGFSPSTLLNKVYDNVERALGGEIDIVDTTTPFATLLEAAASLAAGTITRQEIELRKTYKVLATDFDELYNHMSSAEYLGRFCSYSTSQFFMYLRKDEISVKAVRVPGSEVRKLVIPKHTKIKVDATIFTLLYPIEIRIMPHGGFQIVYDTTVKSPIATLETNFIDWKVVAIDGVEFVMMVFNLPQLLRKVITDTLNPSQAYSREFAFNDQFYYCRVFGTTPNNDRIEFETTHSEQVYDIHTPTALLRWLGDRLRVEIPQIYQSANMLGTTLEVVIYTSKGELNMDFGKDYTMNSFTMELGNDFNEASDSIYSAPLATWTNMAVGSSSKTLGGSNGMTLETLRQNNIDNALNIMQPITYAQIKAKLRLDGYDIINSVDNLMQRIYLATRHLPAVANSGFTSGASTSVETLLTTMDKLATEPTVIDNGNRLTVTPDTVFRHNAKGLLEIVPRSSIPLPEQVELLATTVNSNNYMVTPFHYVLDINDNQFTARPYYLTAPELVSRRFVMENESSLLEVSSDSFQLTKVDNGYVLTVATVCGDTYLELDPAKVFAQLSYIPKNERGRVTINGEMVGITDKGNYVWEFLIETRLDIDETDALMVNNFSMFVDQFRNFPMGLEQEFELIYGVLDYDVFDLKYTEIDRKVATYLLEGDSLGVTNETVTIRFGSALGNLWANTRTVVGNARYLTYDEDVPKVYANTELLLDGTGTPVLTLNGGVLEYTVLHRKGDPYLDAEGNPEYLHRKGDLIYVDGNPVVAIDRGTERLVDFLLIDGVYQFANLDRDVSYRNTISGDIARFALVDLAKYDNDLHEKTELYFYPKKTLGRVKVIVNNGLQIEIGAALSFNVRYYMRHTQYTNLELREAIAKKTREIINQSLQQATVSRDAIQKALKDAMGTDIIAVDMDNLGDSKNIPAFTAIDDGSRCAVRRILKVLPDNSLMVEEDINIGWIDHVA